MKCDRCNKDAIEHQNGMIPIEPKGVKDRKWVCTSCATSEELEKIELDIKNICTAINPNFIRRGE